MFLSTEEAQKLYEDGDILENRQNSAYVRVFSLFNVFHFTSTEKRARKGRRYNFNSPYWKKNDSSLLIKLRMIKNKEVHLINGNNKSYK